MSQGNSRSDMATPTLLAGLASSSHSCQELLLWFFTEENKGFGVVMGVWRRVYFLDGAGKNTGICFKFSPGEIFMFCCAYYSLLNLEVFSNQVVVSQ